MYLCTMLCDDTGRGQARLLHLGVTLLPGQLWVLCELQAQSGTFFTEPYS